MADVTRPHGTLTGPINFAAPVVNPYGLQDAINNAATSFVDIDKDGDLDALIGNNDGRILVQLNTGNAAQPAFGSVAANPYGLSGVGYSANPTFVDIDGDGDLDVFVCERYGNIQFQRNTGTATSPAFDTVAVNPAGLTDVGSYGRPSFVDIDGDGDLDAFFGIQPGNIVLQINSGTAASPAFAAATTNPYGLMNVGALYASPSFVDIDSDGDLDALLGNYAGNTVVHLNTGSATNPRFGTAAVNPYGLRDVGFFFNKACPSFVDIDGDGDLDALIGDLDGNITVQLNTANPSAAVTTTAANGTYRVGSVINLTIVFSEAVIVTGTPSIALETGATDRAATYASGSGSTTLTFSYTVRAGDTAADLDVVNASALKLGGGTITDAAGNNAVLTLAAPAATGSLGANANIVIDGVAPRGALTFTPVLAAATINSYGLTDVGFGASPRLVDIDGDGDLDALIGERYGKTILHLNTGSASSPAFASAITSPYGLLDVGTFASLSLVDIDGDGDLDALIGERDGNVVVQLNVGSSAFPAFGAATNRPYGLVNVGFYASPTFGDIDGDGDLDALIGNSRGNTLVQLNTGNATSPAFGAATTNPYNLRYVGFFASPSLVDIDGDGDLDVLIGNQDGDTLVQLNTGSTTRAAFGAATTNPYGLGSVANLAVPTMVDLDGDGDLDVVIGTGAGNTLVHLNTAHPVAPVTSANANRSYGVSSVITLTVVFNEAVIVTGTPTLQLETGATDRNATYSSGSGTRTLSFQYTVQAGDTSADLDQFSSTALALSGGTIRDAAGNNAVLTLAAPGGQGSLGANKAIVIDGIAPTLAITSNVAAVKAGETATITFTFSEDPGSSFVAGVITTIGGTLGAITGAGLSRTATFTPSVNTTANASITVAAGLYLDAAGNTGSTGTTPVIVIDTLAPTLAITSNVAAVKIGEAAAITFTFSEDPGTSFVAGDIVTTSGSLGVITGSGLTRTATFTPTANLASGWASITVATGLYLDAAGNTGSAGTTPAIAIDTQAPVFASATGVGNQVVLTYTEASTLDAVSAVPANTAFSVTTGGSANAVTVAVVNAAAKTVTLTLTSPITFGQAVTVAYTDPAGDQTAGVIQDAAGNDAASLPATAAANLSPRPPNNPGTGASGLTPTNATGTPPQQDDTLSINTSSLTDPDGLGALRYQWQRDGVAISGATSATYVLTANDVATATSVVISYTDGLGNAERSASKPTSLIQDNDGVPNALEALTPALLPSGFTGDGNADGVQDALQVNVTSGVAPGGANYTTLVADSNKGVTDTLDTNQVILSQVKVDAPPSNLPAGLNLNALLGFKADVGTVGVKETFSIFVDAATNSNGYWVKDATGTWNNLATNIEAVGSKIRVDFAITDGGPFDADGQVNGSIDVAGGAGQMQLSIVGQPPDLQPGSFWF